MNAFWFAVFGGFAVNVLRLAELANTPRSERPETFSDPIYLLQFFVLPFLGGGLAHAYQLSGTVLSPILAVNIGASAPLIFKTFGSAIPPIGPSKVN
jgi:hypothetical protein